MKAKQILSLSKSTGAYGSLRVLGALTLLAAFAGLGFLVVTDTRHASQEFELANHVREINAALAVHRIFHGSLRTDAPEDVLQELQALNRETASIDRRLRAEFQDSEDAASSAPRAVWNRLTDRFEIAHGFVRGVKQFYIDTELDPSLMIEERRVAKLDFEASESWIWDYEEEIEPVAKPLSPHSAKLGRPAAQ